MHLIEYKSQAVFLYGCESWPLLLREERRLKVFEKWVLRRIFGPKRNEVVGGWINLYNESFVTFTIPQIQLE
jgi:hypothetical protein